MRVEAPGFRLIFFVARVSCVASVSWPSGELLIEKTSEPVAGVVPRLLTEKVSDVFPDFPGNGALRKAPVRSIWAGATVMGLGLATVTVNREGSVARARRL